MTKTMTYVEAINVALEMIDTAMATDPNMFDGMAEAQERLEALKVQLGKRNSGSKGMTKTQKANEGLKDIILEILAEAEEFLPMADIMADERLADLSPQKMGALLGQLIKADKAQRYVYKKRTLYAVKGVEFVAPDAEPADGEAE